MLICTKSEEQFNKEKAKAVNVEMPSVPSETNVKLTRSFFAKKTNFISTPRLVSNPYQLHYDVKLTRTYFIPRFPTDILCCIFQLIK